MTPQRIKDEAEKCANGIGDVYRKYAAQYGYITGATAENERAQVLVDALEEIIKYCENIRSTYKLSKPAFYIKVARKALEQWKGGKPDRPCPHCGKELSRDRNLCCRECGEEVEPTNDKCRCVQPNWNAFTGKCLTCGKP